MFNWHMENSNFLYEAAFRATERGTRSDIKVLIMETPFDSFDEETMEFLYPDGFPGWGVEHAAMFETAILLHIAPELVMMDRAVDDGPKAMHLLRCTANRRQIHHKERQPLESHFGDEGKRRANLEGTAENVNPHRKR